MAPSGTNGLKLFWSRIFTLVFKISHEDVSIWIMQAGCVPIPGSCLVVKIPKPRVKSNGSLFSQTHSFFYDGIQSLDSKQTKSDNNASQEIVLLQSTSQTSPVIFSTFLMTFDWIKLSLGHRSGRMMVFRRLRLRTYMHAGMYYVHMCSFQCRLETKRQAQVGHSGVKGFIKLHCYSYKFIKLFEKWFNLSD